MRRFDALAPYKAGVRGLLRAARRDPLLAMALNRFGLDAQRYPGAAGTCDRYCS